MQKLVRDKLRPEGQHDPFGVEEAKGKLATAYEILETDLAGKHWGTGNQYTIADCAASPALFYANISVARHGHPNLLGYLERLMSSPLFCQGVRRGRALLPHGARIVRQAA